MDMREIKRRKRLDESAWREVLERFDGSGVTIGEFCRSEALCLSSFHRWRARLGGPAQPQSMPTPLRAQPGGFVDLGCIDRPDATSRWDIRLDLGQGVVLHLARR